VENVLLLEEESNQERSLKVSPPNTKDQADVDFKATKAGVSKSGMEVNPEDEDTVVKKEEEVC
jgi:hypothetical protein